MTQDVRISILGIQNAGSGPEAILTTTTGNYCFEDGVHRISYCELDEYGNATENFLSFSQEGVRLGRSGAIAGQFLFIPQEKTRADYWSPFGEIIFQVETEYCRIDVKEEGINVQMKYLLYSEGRFFQKIPWLYRSERAAKTGIEPGDMTWIAG